MTPDEFRKTGHELIELIAAYREQVEDMPVRSRSEVGDILQLLPESPPQQSELPETVVEDVKQSIIPGMTHWQHPSFFAYFPANSDLSSVLGDLLSSGLGQLGLNWQSSPPLTEMEQRMCQWLQQMLGLSDAWQGVIQDTASTASLIALLSARERASEHAQVRNGLRDAPELMVYCSSQAHSSIEKAALLAGFGRNQVRLCEVNTDFSIDTADLQKNIEADVAAGKKPCAIVGCTGTTATTAMDNLQQLARLSEEYQCWLHVDGAMAGSAMLLPEMRHLWDGVEWADSVVFNPHKWLGVVFDCSVYFVRDKEHLVRVMSTNPSYLQTAADGQAPNYRDWGIPLGRRFRAMKIWWLLRCEGVECLQKRLRRDINNARWLEQQIAAHPEWSLLAPVALQTVCVVHRPPGLSSDKVDSHTLAWCEAVNASGAAMLTPALLNGRWMVRISVGSLTTERAHVERLWQTLLEYTAKR
ncbi:amino acid decarboxylase [Chromatiales bacterium (ex Bugula neritina AB1)]|nr:amino acid decarboxylase [Chromatiales bacterium (ex Bugula neritina AB1)]